MLTIGHMNWITDSDLKVTELSEGLRDLTGIDETHRRIHVSDVWTQDGPYGFMIVAHRWALDGERVTFESPAHGRVFTVALEPVFGDNGRVVGVSGSASA